MADESCFFSLSLVFIIGAKKLIGASVPLTWFAFHLCRVCLVVYFVRCFIVQPKKETETIQRICMKINFSCLIMSFDDIKKDEWIIFSLTSSQQFEFKVNDLIQYLNRDDEEIRPLAICLPITLPLVL